jgi:hypothetical protein
MLNVAYAQKTAREQVFRQITSSMRLFAFEHDVFSFNFSSYEVSSLIFERLKRTFGPETTLPVVMSNLAPCLGQVGVNQGEDSARETMTLNP